MSSGWCFLLFVISGFCSLVYQVVWLRLTMAHFGVTTAMASIMISVFMAGLAVGSSWGGRLAERLGARGIALPVRAYAACEILIALSGETVPAALRWGREALLAQSRAEWGSAAHHVVAGGWVAVVVLPFAAAMGATLPLALAAMRPLAAGGSGFAHLYAANVLGAAAGTLTSAVVLIELLGFRGTLVLTAGLNALVAAIALALSLRPASVEVGTGPTPSGGARRVPALAATPASPPARPGLDDGDGLLGRLLVPLFTTGMASMAMEVVWIRQFTPQLGNVVYAFAVIVATYLVATFLGSAAYRAAGARWAGGLPGPGWWLALTLAALLPLAFADPRFPGVVLFRGGLPALRTLVQVGLAIGPFCALLGWLTPWLVDRWSRGEARRVGSAYAVNALGCIVGPLLAGFAMLPWMAEPWLVGLLALAVLAAGVSATSPGRRALPALLAALPAVAAAAALSRGPEGRFPDARVRRDSTATVMAAGLGLQSQIYVNGLSMTTLTPITKMMVHLPLAWRDRPARRGLVICFGMGTSFRSMHAWGVDTTAVELVPSVPDFFPEFHADAAEILRSPRARVVVDDGRRFLERSRELYDVVAVDPPPPLEAAGSSLLYSREFYQAVRRRLAQGGIVQAWIPLGEPLIVASCVRALTDEFPHVRGFPSVEGWGLHLLASLQPLPDRTSAELVDRMPTQAVRDLLEWGPYASAREQFDAVLRGGRRLDGRAMDARVPALTDDRPFNEYFILRRWRRARAR